MYPVAIKDWATRKVLAWQLSNTQDASFCIEALNEAIAKYGKPEIMKTYQRSQFTGSAKISALTDAKIKTSMPLGTLLRNIFPVMDGRGRYLYNRSPDGAFIEMEPTQKTA